MVTVAGFPRTLVTVDGGAGGGTSELGFDPDVVEYVVIEVPDLSATGEISAALAQLVSDAHIYILDLVVVRHHTDGTLQLIQPETVPGLAALWEVEGEVGALLGEDDIALAGGALPPGSTAILLVVEDRWAEELAAAARNAHGRIVGGERIPRRRLQALGEAGGPQRPMHVE